MFSNDKMDVKELRVVAKQRRVHGYSKIPKAKLIAAVRETEKQRKISDFYKPQIMLDSPVPDLQEPVLQPTKVEPKSFAERIKHKFSEYKSDFTRRVEVGLSRLKSEIDSLISWLNDQVRKQVAKPVNEKLEAFEAKINKLYSTKDTRDTRDSFEVEESKSALKKFAVQYRIKGKSGYDPKHFLSANKINSRKPPEK